MSDDDYDSFGEDPDGGVDDDDAGGYFDEKEYTVMDKNAQTQAVRVVVEDVAETLNLSQTKTSMLLRAYGWNKERCVAECLEAGAQKILTKKGLMGGEGLSDEIESEAKNGTVQCRICDDDEIDVDDSAKTVACGHRFCNGCWGDYLNDRIQRGKEAILTPCPSFKCPYFVDDIAIKGLVSAEMFAKYSQSILRSFIEDNKMYRWCPSPGCEYAVKGHNSLTSVNCECGYKFCFTCGEEYHSPTSCANLQVWLDKCKNDSETAHWIIANTKKCPKCLVRIEKNQGCNHMTCKSCQFEFCWVCMGVWAEHGFQTGGFYKCNKYDPKKIATTSTKGGEKSSADEAKAELDRYLHYYQRYHNHDQSKKFARRQRDLTEKRMSELQSKSNQSTWMDVQFLSNAMEQVFECRQVLKYTYVFGYYLEDGREKDLFEYLQQQLETTTEHLSEMSEAPIEKIDRAEVVNYTRVTKQFMTNLLDGVANELTS